MAEPAAIGTGRRSRILCWASTGCALVGALAIALGLFDVVSFGWSVLSFDFLVTAPRNAGRAGGIGPILVSTALLLVIALGFALPLSIATAAFVTEFTEPESLFSRIVSRSLDLLAAVPSIVFGLFGNAFFGGVLGLGYSLLSGGLTLACMILPVTIRTLEMGFRAVPIEARWSAAALGLSRTATLRRILFPSIRPALVVGAILGVARALAETAALVFTSGLVDRFPSSLLDSGRALSVHVLELTMNIPGGKRNANGTALVLLGLIIVIQMANRLVTRIWFARGRNRP